MIVTNRRIGINDTVQVIGQDDGEAVCKGLDMKVDLEVIGQDKVVVGVDAKALTCFEVVINLLFICYDLKFYNFTFMISQEFVEGSIVVLDQWVGILKKVKAIVKVKLPDGSIREFADCYWKRKKCQEIRDRKESYRVQNGFYYELLISSLLLLSFVVSFSEKAVSHSIRVRSFHCLRKNWRCC